MIQGKVKQGRTKRSKVDYSVLSRGQQYLGFFGGFLRTYQRKDSDKIIKHIDSQVYIHLINIIKRAKWTERMEIILDRIT